MLAKYKETLARSSCTYIYRVRSSALAALSSIEALVKCAPGVGGDAEASLGSNLGHGLLLDACIADVCEGAHVFHAVLGQRPAV